MAITPVKLPSILQSLGSPGANQADVQTAKDQMAIQLAPQEAGISNTINTIQQYLDQDISAQQQYGQVADQKIGEVGQQLAQQLQGNVGAIGNIYQQGQQQVGNIYDQATQATQAAGSSIRDRLSQSAAQLGQTQALKADPYGNDPISRLLAQQASTETRLAAGKAGTQANLAQLGTQLQGIAQKAVGDSEREYSQKRSDIASDVLRTISSLQIKGQQGIAEQLQKYSILAETAGPTFRTLISQAANARTEAARQVAKDNLEAMATLAKIQKDQAESDPNSIENQIKKTTLAKNLKELGAPDPTKYISDAEGNANLLQFLNTAVRKDRSSPGLSGTQHAGIQNFINQYLPQARMSGTYNTSDPAAILGALAQQNLDPKTGLVKLPVSAGSKYKQQDYEVDYDTLLKALGYRFGNVGPSSKVGTKI